jgi:hypothetical protein
MSSVISQKDAVKSAITQVLTEAGVKFDDNSNFKDLLTREHRAQVNQILFEGFRSGSIAIKKEKSDPELKEYVSGLVSNWLKKDTTLSGGVAYVVKNPGSRTGSTDPQIKALRALMKMKPEQSEEIQGYIDARLELINASKPSKTKTVKVDVEALPEALRHLA